jgi:hypothetical protein
MPARSSGGWWFWASAVAVVLVVALLGVGILRERTGPEGRTTVNLTAPATARDYPEIEITREPDDGNPEASGEEVLEGKLRST